MEEFAVPIDLQADRLKATLEENVRLKEQIADLKRENRKLEELDEINNRHTNDLNRQASALRTESEVLREVIRMLFASR